MPTPVLSLLLNLLSFLLFLFDLVLLSSELMWGMGLGLGFLFFLGFDSDWDEGVSLSVFF